ncbi:MAG: FAD-dependent oxidoreductase, partial [Thermosynechococcaceae cyanobacterium]
IQMVQKDLTTCVPGFGDATVIDHSVIRLPRAVTHFAPGSYQYLLPAQTEFNNVFLSGDWIVNRHGSWSQEKAYVTGLEAANLVCDRIGQGQKALIIPVEEDEPHIQIARTMNRTIRNLQDAIVPHFWLP